MDAATVQMFVDEVTKIGKGQIPSRSDDPKDDKKLVTDAGATVTSPHASAPTDDYTKMAEGKMDKKPGDSPDRGGVEGGKNWHEPMSGQGKPPPKPTYDVGASPSVIFEDLSPAVGQDEKTGSVIPEVAKEQKKAKDPGFKPLSAIPEITKTAMFDELNKLAADNDEVTAAEAWEARRRLRQLSKKKLTGDVLARGALTGAIVGPTALLASKLVGGGIGKGLVQALKVPGTRGKVMEGVKTLFGGARQLGGAAAGSATFGAAMPTIRQHLDEAAEKEKLRQYLGTSKLKGVRGKIKRTVGV